ncbi:MAG: Flp pilus assembly protein CpaB, partial [Ruminococcaceae bacterium]|nr:Flp pilus assembly protein CpaB [Oscillospiraceae bacterium]
YVVKEGMRAISINVTDVEGVSGMLKPGNHIDLIAQYETETGAVDETGIPIKEQAARIILQNVEILAVDAYMTPAGAPSDVGYTKLTLSVTPEQAIELSFVDNLGTIRAVLRSTLDEEVIEEHSITVDDIHITRD